MNKLKNSLRRHHEESIKANRVGHVNIYSNPQECVNKPTAKQIGKVACTAKNCSCYMCGNPRKFFNEPTLEEKSFLEINKE